MSTHRIDGPNGPEEVHLLEEEEVTPQVREARKADRAEGNRFVFIGFAVVVIAITGLAMAVWERPYALEFFPEGNQLRMVRKHWARSDGFMLLERHFDPAYGERGWCVWAADSGEKPKWHLVVGDDGETIMATRDDWWKD